MKRSISKLFSGMRSEKAVLAHELSALLGVGTGVRALLRAKLPELNRPAEQVLWVYNCVKARADAIMQAPVRLSDADGNLIEGGPLAELLRKPNRWMDGTQFIGAVESMLSIFECAFILPVGDGPLPDELMLLSSTAMRPIVAVHGPSGMRMPVGYQFRDPQTGATHDFALDELIVMVSFNPHNPLAALAPTAALMASMELDVATRVQNTAVFVNGGIPDWALVTDKPMDEERAKEFLKRVNDHYSGVHNAHKVGLFHSGVKPEKLGLSPAELLSVDVLRTLTPQEIVSGMGCVPAMVGLLTGETGLSSGTSTTEQIVGWWGRKGNGEIARIGAALQNGLVDRYPWPRGTTQRTMSTGQRAAFATAMRMQGRAVAPGRSVYVWLDTGNVPELAEHRWKRIEGFDRLINRGYRPDEINDYFDLGLPEHPTNEGLVPFSVQPVSDVRGGSVIVGEVDRIDAGAGHDCRHVRALDGLISRLEGQGRAEVAEKWLRLRKTLDGFLGPREKGAARKWSRFFMEQRKRVLDRLGAMRTAKPATRDETPLATGGADEDSLIRAIFSRADEDASLVARIGASWRENLRDGWNLLNETVGVGDQANPFDVDDPRVMSALDQRRIQGLRVNDTTESDLRAILRSALDEGYTLTETADSIADYYARHIGESASRPLTAARTQVAGTVNDGMLASAMQLGGLRKGWLHGGSEQPREAHVSAQAQYLNNPIPLDEPFVVNGYECQSPGSTELPVGEAANCTCMMVFTAEAT